MENHSALWDGVTSKFLNLPQFGQVQAEYIWIGGSGQDVRSKTRTFDFKPNDAKELPEWNYDGSSTSQAPGEDSEVILKPCRIFRDPFRGGDNILVMCDTYTPAGQPLPTNKRFQAKAYFDQDLKSAPWFGLEQEYTLFEPDGVTPLGWPRGGFPAPQGPYYCGAGARRSYGRAIVEAHYRACLFAGIKISGCNAEVMPGQWEYQVGPCEGIDAGDQLWCSRYIMERIGELYNVVISFDPKPIQGDWNGAGCHTNYSTKAMRERGGWSHIIEAIEELGKFHLEHIRLYDCSGGEDNKRRLTGRHETAHWSKFCYGVANRGASIRIPRTTEQNQCGYFEDRRPASNMDPYVVTSKIFATTVLKTGHDNQC